MLTYSQQDIKQVTEALLVLRPPSVFINPKETDAVELRQFGDKHGEQGNGVDDEVDPVILCIETGEEIPAEGRTRIRSSQASQSNT